MSLHHTLRRLCAVSLNNSIYVSTSTNPYFNLTLEDWLFKNHLRGDPLLLLYRDSPCVVLGRNQNPWAEVNISQCRRRNVPWIRRKSGGGTVYHDLGNTNFSIHLPRSSFDRRATAKIPLRAVRSLGIDARVNERNDICVGPDKMSPPLISIIDRALIMIVVRYVSGSAYKIVNKRAYHHGTMLISTQLNELGDLLHTTNKETMKTKGVSSVRSPVCNLRQWNPDVTHEAFVAAVISEFKKTYGIDGEELQTVHEDAEMTRIEFIKNGMAELPSWEWKYGQTPEFTYTVTNLFPWGSMDAEIHVKRGVVLSCLITPGSPQTDELSKFLEGKRYGFVGDGNPAIAGGGWMQWMVWGWLKNVMDN